jgi:hypothetical protein
LIAVGFQGAVCSEEFGVGCSVIFYLVECSFSAETNGVKTCSNFDYRINWQGASGWSKGWDVDPFMGFLMVCQKLIFGFGISDVDHGNSFGTTQCQDLS